MSDRVPPVNPVSMQGVVQLRQMAQEEAMMVVESQEDFLQYVETSPFVIYQRFLPMQQLKASAKKSEEEQAVKEKKILEVESAEETAARFQRNNEELKSRTLLMLKDSMLEKDSAEEVLNKVLRTYADHALADEALDFLIQTCEGKVKENAQAAKELLNRNFAREVAAGRNMGAEAREFSKTGLGSASSLRDLYRDIIRAAREPLVLFQELTDKFPYQKLNKVISFLLRALGADLRSKGPSIPRGELKRLLDEVRSLQGILGIFRFFQSRVRLMEREFSSYQIAYPPRFTFEFLGKMFIKLLAERFVNAEKILQFASVLGLSEELLAAQMIIFTQYRDALRQISPRYFRNQQHQAELLKGFIEAIERLEDKLEEEE